MEKTLKQSELRKSESWPINTQWKDKVRDKPCRQWRYANWYGKNEKLREFKYLRQTIHLKDTKKKKSMPGSEQHGAVLENNNNINKGMPQDRRLPISLKTTTKQNKTKQNKTKQTNKQTNKQTKNPPEHKQQKQPSNGPVCLGVMDQCVLPTTSYGCQTWSLNKTIDKQTENRSKNKMLGRQIQRKVSCSQIGKRTKIIDIIEYTVK